jgi:rSAM/selenodomain-associated transferase 2
MNPPLEKKSFPWKRVLAVVVTVAALAVVFSRIDLQALGRVLLKTHLGWYLTATLAFGLALLCAAWRWHLMLRLTGAAVHLLASVRVYFIGQALGIVLLGPAGGDLAKSAVYARWFRQGLPQIFAAAPLDRLLGLGGLALFCLPAIALAAAKGVFTNNPNLKISIPYPWLAAAAVCGVIGLVIAWRWRPKSDSGPARFFNAFAGGLKQVLVSPSLAATGLTLGFIVQALSCAVFALSLKAVVAGDYPWLEMLWVFPVVGAMSVLPSVSGLGLREGVSIVLLKLYGIDATDAVAASLLGTGSNLIWAAVGGAVLWREEQLFENNSTKAPAAPAPGPNAPAPSLSLSIVIPALNEAAEIAETITRCRKIPQACEIIVVDGGSTDATPRIAAELGCQVITSEAGRGRQLRAGAAAATGDVIVLLHADTWLPAEAGEAIDRCLHDSSLAGGGFWKVFRGGSPLMRGSRFKCFLRLVLARRVMGDQALFVRRAALAAAGGVPPVPLMEEFELCRKLRQQGRLALADAVVSTSARRFEKLGVWRTYARMWRVTLLYLLGKSPEELRKLYER